MRLKTSLLLSLGLLLVVPSAVVVSTAAAQDEFDEFEDDFADPEPEPQPEPAPAAEPAEEDEFADLEDDAFAETDEDEPALEEGDLEAGEFDDEAPPDAEPETPSQTPTEEQQAYRERRHLMHNSWYGSVGGIHIVDAASGAAGAFRAQLGLDFFFVDGWLTLRDAPMDASESHSHIGGSLSLSWTPWEFLEIYASIASWANSNAQEVPNLFQVLGDTLFGVKAFYQVEGAEWLYLGGDLSLGFLNTVGDIGLVGESTSVGIRANVTADLRELADRIPFIARLNLQYWFDNSSALVSSVEAARYAALPDPRSCPMGEGADPADCQEDRHLITRVERYSLQIDRVDRFRIGIGLEAPLQVMEDFYINPIAEWVLDIPVNRQGFSCLYIPDPSGAPAFGQDGCLDKQGVSAFEQTLTLGVRVLPPLRGLSIFAAVDIGLTGVNTFVRELSGQEPYNVRLGFGYAYDTIPQVREVEREVVREVVREAEPPPKGRILGTVVEQGADTPIEGAAVAFPGREVNAIMTDGAGFTSYEFDPGEVEMTITHPEYHEGTCTGTIPEEGGDVEVRCELEALPRVGSVRGTVTGEGGSPVGGAQVRITGPAERTLNTGLDGVFTLADVPPGTYTARVEAEDYLIKQETFDVVAREQATPQITLISRPRRSMVRVARRQIVIRRQVNFATDSAEILPSSTELLSEVADVIMRHPEITRIEVQGHTDNRGGQQHNMELSQRRAEAVRDWLVRAGVDASRLEAQGYGQEQPLVPNITASNRARNRRVQFLIQEQTEAE